MNVFNKVTLESLKKNKTRTLVTIIGIILSAAMLTAVTTFISSLQGYMYDVTAKTNGEWHGMFNAVQAKDVETLKSDSRIKSLFSIQSVGYSKLEGCANEYKPYLFIMGADDSFLSSMPVTITSGRMPENTSEIILPDHLKTNGSITHKIGDVLNLSIGKRMLDGENLSQLNEYSGSAETLSADTQKTYTVVGFYERPYFEAYSAPGYTAITKYDDSLINSTCSVFFQMNKPKETFEVINEHKDWQGDENTELLMVIGASKYENFNTVLYSLAAILMVLIMFGSVSLIYNAFSISISERTKQFGLLSSVGATKKQISKSVFFEASVLSAIGIPIGIISGIAGIGVTLWCLGDKFASLYNGGTTPAAFNVRVNIWAIIIAAIVALITVMISAFVPSRRARKVTAIEAIRQSNDIKAKQKDVHVSALTYKLFGLPGVLAKKHFKRNRKKYRATIISLFMSIVLFISSSSLCIYLEKSVGGVFQAKDYDISYSAGDVQTVKKVAKRLSEVNGVKSTTVIEASSAEVDLSSDCLDEEYTENAAANGAYFAIVGVDDETFKAYLKENKLDRDKYMDAENPLGVSVKQISYFSSKQGKMINLTPLKKDSGKLKVYVTDTEKYSRLSEEEATEEMTKSAKDRSFSVPLEINVGSVQKDGAIGCSNFSSSGVITVMYAQSVLEKMLKNYNTESMALACFAAKDHKAVMEKFEQTFNNMDGISAEGLDDVANTDEVKKNLVTIVEVFAYGFITLISLIAVANVFNTISTNINLRRREFAMLKSVGMTKGGLNKMMNFECLLYGFKALILGLPVSFLIVYLIFISVDVGYTMSFFIPWQPVLIAVLSVFVVVFITMMYSMSKVKKDNPIGALRNENQ